MEQAKKEMLAAAGIDAEDALERFMGSEALLTRFLGRFLEDASMDALRGAVAAGDWDKARSLCADTDDMESYCHTFRQFWEKSMKKDSALLATAAGVLEESDMSLSDGRHEGKGTFSTLFTITTDSGASKTRIVQLKKEDGIWLVTMIQDAGQGLPVRN